MTRTDRGIVVGRLPRLFRLPVSAAVIVAMSAALLAAMPGPRLPSAEANTAGVPFGWGFAQDGQLGNGQYVNSQTAPVAAGVSNVSQLAAGDDHSLFLRTDGQVWSSGRNYNGQLGDGTTSNSGVAKAVPGMTDVVTISAGASVSAAVKSDGSLWMWGENQIGQMGNGTTSGEQTTPRAVPGLVGVTQVAVNSGHTLALTKDGSVWSWGRNNMAQLGLGTVDDLQCACHTTPTRIPGLPIMRSVAVSQDGTVARSLAISHSGEVWVWGDYVPGDEIRPTRMPGLSSIVALASGAWHDLALRADGIVFAWGNGKAGSLGDGSTEWRYTPVQVANLSGVVAISAAWINGLALKSDGTVWVWGPNLHGELANGQSDFSSALVPVRAGGLSGITALGNSSSTLFAWTRAASPTTAGSTWYSDGTKSKQLASGSRVTAYASGVIAGVPYQLVMATGSSCAQTARVLNPTIVYGGSSGLLGRVTATMVATPGTYFLCFREPGGSTATGVVTLEVVAANLPAVPNVLKNGEFDDPSVAPWSLWLSGGGNASFVADRNSALSGRSSGRVSISAAGVNYTSVQVRQDLPPVTAGKTYRFSFVAKSDAARPEIRVGIRDKTGNFTEYWNKYMFVSPTYSSYQPQTFIAPATSSTLELVFYLGGSTVGVNIDSVVFAQGADLPSRPTNLVANSDFNGDFGGGWINAAMGGAGIDASSKLYGLKSAFGNGVGTSLNDSRIEQTLNTAAGVTYELTFLATADAPRSMSVSLGSTVIPIEVDTDVAIYGPFPFTATGPTLLRFSYGGNSTRIYLDGVIVSQPSLLPTGDLSEAGRDLVPNGTNDESVIRGIAACMANTAQGLMRFLGWEQIPNNPTPGITQVGNIGKAVMKSSVVACGGGLLDKWVQTKLSDSNKFLASVPNCLTSAFAGTVIAALLPGGIKGAKPLPGETGTRSSLSCASGIFDGVIIAPPKGPAQTWTDWWQGLALRLAAEVPTSTAIEQFMFTKFKCRGLFWTDALIINGIGTGTGYIAGRDVVQGDYDPGAIRKYVIPAGAAFTALYWWQRYGPTGRTILDRCAEHLDNDRTQGPDSQTPAPVLAADLIEAHVGQASQKETGPWTGVN